MEERPATPAQPQSAGTAASPTRRRLLQAGLVAAAVPVVMTIKGRPAWAGVKDCQMDPNSTKCTSKDLRKLSGKLFPSRAAKK